MHTPVVLLIFNRPDFTERVFAEIARARPPKLLVIADGPRPGRSDEAEKCAAARTERGDAAEVEGNTDCLYSQEQ